MTDDVDARNERTLMERFAALEQKCETMEKALRRAFGDRWYDEQKKKDGDAGSGGV